MATYKFTNNAKSTLASEIGASDSSLSVTSGEGALFPEVSAGDGNQFYVLVKEGSTEEWMLCTSRSGDTFSVVTRASSSYSFSAGAVISLRLNATILDTFLQKGVYRTNAGSPNGSLAASYTGEEVLDSTNNIWYKHVTGTTWKAMSGT